MDHAHAQEIRSRTNAAPVPKPKARRGPEQPLLDLQRTAGNRAVVEALTTVQRHSLDPEQMDEQGGGQ